MRRLLLLPLLLLVAILTAAQPEPTPLLLAQLDTLETKTSDLRGLRLDSPVERLFPAREVVAAFVAGQLSDPETQQYYVDLGRVYAAFDLLDPELNLVAALQELLVAQIGGYYDPEAKTMNTLLITGGELTDRLPLLEQIVYVHEFTHALQDSNFDMTAFLGGEDDIAYQAQFPDETLARLALIEGDATEVMTQFVFNLAQEDPAAVLNEMEALIGLVSTMVIPPGTPKILELELTFPYIQGQSFVQALLAEGGWELVNEAFTTRPPASSEQIIDPQKWIADEQPQTVVVEDVSAALGETWPQLYKRTGGEFFLRRFLETQLGPIDVIRAASGWGGDTYRLYVNESNGSTAWVWRLAWDTPEDAVEFYEAMQIFLDARYADSTSPVVDMCWGSDIDVMCLAKAGNDVIVTKALGRNQAPQMRDLALGN